MSRKRVSLGPNAQTISGLESSALHEESLLQPTHNRSSFQAPPTRQSIRRSLVPTKKHLNNEEIKKMYAECYLMCDQRKVNEKNVWTLPLIDYMNDCIEVDAEENKGSANFVKAGLAIDAGVQIYSVRVDAVHKKTFAVVDTIKQAEAVETQDGDLSSFDETPEKLQSQTQQSQNPEDQGTQKKTKRRKGVVNTLEKHPKSLQSKSEKVEYHRDRLFHQRISAMEGKSIMQDITHNFGDFLSGDFAEVVDIEDEDVFPENPEIEWKGVDLSNLNITEINNDGRSALVQSIVDDLKTPAATQQPTQNIELTQKQEEQEKMATQIFDNLPVDEEFNEIDNVNPVDDNGGEILPGNDDDVNVGNPEILAPVVEKNGFTYFDPNIYNIKEIRRKIKAKEREGKFMKKTEVKKREKKEKVEFFDLREQKPVSWKSFFNKKPTTTELKVSDKIRPIFEEVNLSLFNGLVLAKKRKIGNEKMSEKKIENVRNDNIQGVNQNGEKSQLGLSRLSLMGARPSIMRSMVKGDEEEEERMVMRSDDEEEKRDKKETFTQVPIPRMINFEKITAATKPKNLDYDGCEKLIEKILVKETQEGRDEIEFQDLLNQIYNVASDKEKADLSVAFIFVSVNIMCFRKGMRLVHEDVVKLRMKN
ncbi:hypothetical protein EIN_498300 [Entamoeba invadens IP1]|uniref:Condensin complex subunit 2 n=1 Tax=Entamoeba invadens IP1 TaxID=370355 RepID=A0A0A1UG92_ENTIV|nr:hypothetical protein EIN_498300 [Entamoeba invadens IP1]ELP94630.1 hypothetical protein EIN_498300 [Entamoeba invadens IP1]|eukprot:XP_004261401.1 hypothetical protein EIN_498300 [Entamoeba invadens IP1]